MIDQDLLKELFDYVENTGELIRKNTKYRVNIVAGGGVSKSSHGYLEVYINGKNYLVHRLVWLYHYGYFPESIIDHIDKNKYNNRLENLREVNKQCNARNSGNFAHNTSGVKGVYWAKKSNKWIAQIYVDGKTYVIGSSKYFYESVCLRLSGEQCLNWSNCDSNSPAYLYVKENIQ